MSILEYFDRIDNNVYFFRDLIENFSMTQLFSIKEVNFVRALTSYLLISKISECYCDGADRYLFDILSDYFKEKKEDKIEFNGIQYYNTILGVKHYNLNSHLLKIYEDKFLILDNIDQIIFSKEFCGTEEKIVLCLFNKYIITADEYNVSIYSYVNNKYVVSLKIDEIEIEHYFYFPNFFMFIYDYDVYIIENLESFHIKKYNMECNNPIVTTSLRYLKKYTERNLKFL